MALTAGPAAAKGGEVGGSGSDYHLSNTFSTRADLTYSYGRPSDRIYVGDWDGDGTDTLAVRRGATYYFRNAHGGGGADRVVTYGRPDDVVLVGDWDGDGTDTLAVRRGAAYHVKNSLSGGPADDVVVYGRADDVVLVGDWDGDGDDTFAVRRGSAYHVKNSLTPGAADRVAVYGRTTDTVYVGDWDGDEDDTFTVRRGAQYFVANEIRPGPADMTVVYGRASDTTLVGDWNGDGRDSLGVRRNELYRGVAERAVAAAVALDEAELARWASPDAAREMMYAFGEFYEVQGPFSVGECLTPTATTAVCKVDAEDFDHQAVGTTALTWDGQRWLVTEYSIWSD
ncbi:hypothetical protein KZX45_14650 [Georgenia sp. EYE_87]|uniref:hypothetical protein n=1 Tax=Georgenia sp. EYE_87 TaxID=2853448 RepID=UPI002003F5C6|nr:hypothetical protein [Georgenia sp. EYE_87]MCK6211786.1 hypothetical protein [Georgenia sp. EYE_87]